MKSKTVLKYELWSGKRLVGVFETHQVFAGKAVNFYDPEKGKGFLVPISYKIDVHNEISSTYTVILDVRKKSKRQIDLILTKA